MEKQDINLRRKMLYRVLRRSVVLPSFLLATVLAPGCATVGTLQPAPSATLGPGTEGGVSEADGVRVLARPHSWNGVPVDLGDVITPMEVTIENNSGRELQIRYRDFHLEASPHFHDVALPPYRIDDPLTFSPVVPEFLFDRFYLSPYFARFYSWDFDDWTGPFGDDDAYVYDYGSGYPTWDMSLPTRDMLKKGLPEGVLESGGSLTGFLYFGRVGATGKEVDLVVDLSDASSGKVFGTLRIPFVEHESRGKGRAARG